jgi:hypothetical protein
MRFGAERKKNKRNKSELKGSEYYFAVYMLLKLLILPQIKWLLILFVFL